MADIFLSYAQKAPEPTQTLAAELAALKYSVWFDQRLLPIDTFIEVINTELDASKAVITIWTPPAFESRWVKAEALRAFDQNKLLNLHTPDAKPDRIPVPFNAAHISPIADRKAMFEALAKLGVHPGGAAPVEKAASDASEAALAFEHIKTSADIDDFEAFLADFADGKQFYIRRGAAAWWWRSRRRCRCRRRAMCSCASSRGCTRRRSGASGWMRPAR